MRSNIELADFNALTETGQALMQMGKHHVRNVERKIMTIGETVQDRLCQFTTASRKFYDSEDLILSSRDKIKESICLLCATRNEDIAYSKKRLGTVLVPLIGRIKSIFSHN